MENILIGKSVAEQVFILNGQLRKSTHNTYATKCGASISSYSPWVSIFPVSSKRPHRELLECPTFERGGLVTDEAYLARVRQFITHDAFRIIDGLPHSQEDWLPDGGVTDELANIYRHGKRLLVNSCTSLSRLYAEFVDYVIPLTHGRNRGYSTHLARGVIFRSFPPNANAYDVAIDLAHELGHQVLMTWQSVDGILKSDPDQPVFSEIRLVDRPAIQSFHAAVALAYMLYFVQSLPDDPACQEAGIRRGKSYRGTLQESLVMAIKSLRENCQFTAVGARMLDEMQLVADSNNP